MTSRILTILTRLSMALALATLPVASAQEGKEDPALEQYFIANGAYNQGLYAVAITQYQDFLAKHADHAKADLARNGLALSLYAMKQYDKAMPVLATLLARPNPDASISRERLIMVQGQCLLLTDKKDDAKKLFVAEIGNLKADAYRAGALAAICDVSFGKSEWDDVLAWSEKLLGAKADAAQLARGLYLQGYAHYQKKNPDAAIASLSKIAGLNPDKLWKTRADYLLGECHNLRKEFDKAEAAFVAALPGLEGKDASECRYRLGLTRFALNKYQEARGDLEAYLTTAKEPANASEAKLYAARAALELKDFDQAASKFSELSAGEDETAAQANLWLARVQTRKDRDYEKTAEILAPAVGRFKDSPIADDLQFDYANALMARKSPDWKTALGLLHGIEARGKFTQLPEVLSQRAVCQHRLGDYAGSLGTSEAFLAKFGDHPLATDARFLRAENLFLLNRLDEAATAYGEFLNAQKEHPNSMAASYRLAQIQHDQGHWAECLAIAAPLLEKKPEGRLYAQLPFLVGDCLFRQEKWEEALQALQAFLAPYVKGNAEVTAEANVDTALMQLAVAHDRLGKKPEALADLALLAGKYPSPTPQLPLALAEQGRLAFESGDLKLARSALERFLAEEQKDADPFKKGAPAQRARVHYYLGWVESTEGKNAEAATNFAEVLKIDPNHALAPDAALQQGVALVSDEKFDEAAKHFQDMLGRYPQHEKLSRVVYYAGLSLARQKQWDPAKNHFKRIVEQFADSEFADLALYEWAWCERRLEHTEETVKLYEKLLATHAESPLAIKVESELAELNLESGAQDKVIAQLTQTMTKVKDEALREDIRYQLATAHFRMGDHAQSATQFEQLLKDYPQSKLLASILFQAGESRLKLGETVAARDHFAAATATSDVPEGLAESIAMRLAETQALTDAHADAQKSYLTFLEKFPESRWKRNAQFGLAFAMESGGDSVKAIPEYRKLLEDQKVDLWTVRARYQIGECLFNTRKYDEAVAEFLNVEINFAEYPGWQAKAVLEIGRVLLAQNDKEKAAERFKDVITRYPKESAATVAQQYLDEIRAN
jgi:TolA-binding protein